MDAKSYMTEDVIGTCTPTQNGFVNWDVSGIQNGAPDGIALVDSSNIVIEFISYEGSLTASDGPAAGMTSIDIGVSESSTTAIGTSLQRVGSGCTGGDFTWQRSSLESKGAINDGQIISCMASIWINELHYDNSGSDIGEFVEIACNAEVDVTGYKLVFYNGMDAKSYMTEDVIGTCTPTQNGFVNWDVSGIQNGAPDGIALVDSSNIVIEFISYEGSLTASDGPAAGMTSIDIGVSESSTTAIGTSLQRVGSGCTGDDFTWQGSSLESKGAINDGQIISCDGTIPVPTPTVGSPTPTPDTYLFVKQYYGFELTLYCDKSAQAGYAVGYAYNLTLDQNDLGTKREYTNDFSVPNECQQQFSGTNMPSYQNVNCDTDDRINNEFCYDRGHIVMGNHMDGTPQTRQDASYVTNLVPQASGFNQNPGAWKETEDIIECHRDYPDVDYLEIFGGMIYSVDNNDFFIESHGIPTPDLFYKVVVKFYKDSSKDPDVIAWLMKNAYYDKKDRLDLRFSEGGDLIETSQLKVRVNDPLIRLPEIYTEKAYEDGFSWDHPNGCYNPI